MSKTAQALSFLPGIGKLLKENHRLLGRVAELESALSLRRGSAEHDPLNGMLPVPPVYYISPQLGVAYLQIPKAACSSFKAMILQAEKPGRYRKLQEELASSVWPLHHTSGLFETSSRAGNLLRLTFVRHPFDRVLSFYRNQINPTKEILGDRLRVLQQDLAVTGFRFGMGFEDYINLLVSSPEALADPHVRPQVEFLIHPFGMTVDYLGKIEQMPRHQGILRKVLNRPDLTVPKLNTTGAHTWQDDARFTPEIVSVLTRCYLLDLALLGYANTP